MNEEKLLQEHGLKVTRARLAILKCLSSSGHPMTAEEVFNSLSNQGMDLSTVYRSLNSFHKAGLSEMETNSKKENAYSLPGEDRHFLVCSSCGKRIPLVGCPYHEANEKIESETGFLLPHHGMDIYGVCPDCQKAGSSR